MDELTDAIAAKWKKIESFEYCWRYVIDLYFLQFRSDRWAVCKEFISNICFFSE